MTPIRKLLACLMAGLFIFTFGCSSVKQVGKVGNLTFYSVSNARLFAPNYNALVVRDNTTEAVRVEQVFGGAPASGQVLGAAIQGGSIVGGAYLLGHSFPKNVGDTINSSGGTSSSNTQTSNSSAASNEATGGAGGNATATSSATGGAGGSGSFTPPGLVNNPGHTP